MFTLIIRLLALFGFLVIAGLIALAVLVARLEPTLPERVILGIDLDRPLADGPPGNRLEALFDRQPSLRDIVDALDRGRQDARVKGLVARISADSFGFAQAQELRAAVERFRASGRFAFAYADSFGDGEPANRAVFLASGFDEVWLQPLGVVGLTGVAMEVPFLRGALDTLSVEPQFQQREEYKSFADTFMKKDFTPAHREMLQALIGDLSGQMVEGIAQGRRLAPATVRGLIDRAPLLDSEALEARLVDRLGYRDEAEDAALSRAGQDAETLDPLEYLAAAGHPHRDGPTVAVIQVTGTITGGESRDASTLGEIATGSDTVVTAFDDAIDDDDVVAILLRIDSGGGSVTASESIRRAVVRARAAGKPVVASMGDTAASGGYWVAMNADRIIASPGTLTGSIGVVAGKIAAEGLSERLGVHWGVVEGGRNAGIWSPLRPFTPSQQERLTAIIDSSYQTFLSRVAEARKLPPDAVRAAAKGRVWSGLQARELGLVDELGDMEAAVAAVRRAAGLAADAPVSLTPFPEPETAWEMVRSLTRGQGLADAATAVAAVRALRPVLARLGSDLTASAGVRAVAPPTGLAPLPR